MNSKAIIASLVLGSSSVAMAHPSATFSATAQGSYDAAYGTTTVIRDHRVDDNCNSPVATQPVQPIYYGDDSHYGDRSYHGDDQRVFRGEWKPPVYRPVTLASGLHFANDGRTFITVGSQAGRFEALQISAAGNRTFIQQVYVQFENGQEQVVRNINRTLVGNESLTIDLDGGRRAIRRIVVYGNPLHSGWNGWRRAAGAFTVTAS
jgi:hypothetical protein